VLGPNRLVDERLVLVHIRLRVPPPRRPVARVRAVYPAGEAPRPDSRLSVISMVVMEPVAPLTRSNRASGVGVIVKMVLILSGST
jgi:hypothetical protein